MGKVKQPKEVFEPLPPGWSWDGVWEIKPDESIMFEPDEGRDEWTEEVYENQTRHPLSNWPDDSEVESVSFWTDVVSEVYISLQCPLFFNICTLLSTCLN